MVGSSFPAKEEDYIVGFIDNLQWEIQFRISGYKSMSRLIDVYYAAKFEESMLVIEETLKQIKENLDLDPNEPQMHDSNNSTEAIVELEDDSQNFVMENEVECKMELTTDKSTEPNLAGLNMFSGNYHFNSRIEEVELLHKGEMVWNEKFQQSYSFKNEVAEVVYQVFDEMPYPGQTTLYSLFLLSSFAHEETDDSPPIQVYNLPLYNKLDVNIWLNKILLLIFDPGGCCRPHIHTSCGSFKCCNEQADCSWAVNMAEHLIISDPLITCQEACNERSEPNVQEVKTFILAAPMTGSVNGSTNRSTMAWLENVTSILKVVLGKNVMEDNAHEGFDKRSKIRTVDGILLFVYDPGGSFPLQMDCEALNFDIRFQHTITLHYAAGVLADWDYTINMSEIISKVIEMCLVQVVSKTAVASSDCPYKHLSMPISAITMVYYGSIVTVTCLLFVHGGGYLLLTASRDTLSGKYPRNAESSVPKDMCVGMVELGSNKAYKPLIELLVDYLFLTKEALDLDDVELGHMTFPMVLTMLLPWVVPKIVVVSSEFSIKAGVISLLVRKDVRTFRHFYVVAVKIKNLYGGELATEMVMFNGVDWNLQTEQDWSVWPEAISLDITIIHCLAETFCQLLVLKAIPKLWLNVKEWSNLLMVLNGDFSGQLQPPVYCHSISLYAFHNLSCMIGCFISCGLKHFQRYVISDGYDGVICIILQNYVWDPGQNIIFLCILEDKDVVVRVGKDMVLIDTTLVIMGYDHEVEQCAEGDIFQRPSTMLLTLTLSCKVGERSSIIQFGVVMIDPSFIMVVENFVWDPGLILAYFQFSTLRTRWLLRGRICHESTFYYIFYYVFSKLYS